MSGPQACRMGDQPGDYDRFKITRGDIAGRHRVPDRAAWCGDRHRSGLWELMYFGKTLPAKPRLPRPTPRDAPVITTVFSQAIALVPSSRVR